MNVLFELTQRYESFFGDPANGENDFSYQASLDADRHSEFPQPIIDRLNQWGLAEYYVPQELGGKLVGYDALFHLIRLTSRRDLTAAIGHGKTMLGAISVWIAGSPAQQQRLADSILNYDAVALALTEQPHGSDISASDSFCSQTPTGYRLNGSKYLINNARRAAALTVYARTAANNNARDFSLFIVEKSTLPVNALSYVPKLLTHGIKGADISGIRFHNAPLEASTLIGQTGQGLEIMLCGFQLTRTLCTALSCGAGDHALRLAWQYAHQREVYHAPLVQLAVIRRRLGNAALDVLIADTVSLFSSRAINILPQQMSIISAAAKAFVPASIEAMVDDMVDVLGARAYLESDGPFSSFSKLQRDCRLVSLFDGSTVINLQALVVQLPMLARQRRRQRVVPEMNAQLGLLFSVDEPLEALQPSRLKLSSKGQDFIVQSLYDAARRLSDVEGFSADTLQTITRQLGLLRGQLDEIDEFFLQYLPTTRISPRAFAMAQAYTRVFAAACSLQAFIYSHRMMSPQWRDGLALSACLDRLTATPADLDERVLDQLQTTLAQHLLISFFPLPLATSNERGAQ